MSLRTFWPAGLVAFVAALLLLLQLAWRAEEQAKAKAEAAEARVASADGQGQLERAAGGAVEAARAREVVVSIRAKEAAHEIAEAAGGDATLASGVLDRWAAAVDGLRGDVGAGGRPVDDPGGGDVAQPVPAPHEAEATVSG